MTPAGASTYDVPLPTSAYIHVPFCRHRCGYCNFTVIAGRDDLAGAYLHALELELSRLQAPRPVHTIFLGGGTPTHLSAAQLARLLEVIQDWFPLAPEGEFSVEANPRDVLDREKLALLRRYGATRLSLGAQSFDSPKLGLLERDHDAAIIRQAVDNARHAGFDVALDLIFGAPGESLPQWRDDLAQALALSPDHVSTYGLTFEKGTQFWNRLAHGELRRVAEELERDMYVAAIDTLTAAGFEHYEVSNFARQGKRCRHNETYWLGREYYAAGPGASRYVAGTRETNHASTTTWLARVSSGQSPVAMRETLGSEDRARERLVFGLRRMEGVNLTDFTRETGWTVAALVDEPLATFIERGLLQQAHGRLQLTRAGLLVSDAIWPYFLKK